MKGHRLNSGSDSRSIIGDFGANITSQYRPAIIIQASIDYRSNTDSQHCELGPIIGPIIFSYRVAINTEIFIINKKIHNLFIFSTFVVFFANNIINEVSVNYSILARKIFHYHKIRNVLATTIPPSSLKQEYIPLSKPHGSPIIRRSMVFYRIILMPMNGNFPKG